MHRRFARGLASALLIGLFAVASAAPAAAHHKPGHNPPGHAGKGGHNPPGHAKHDDDDGGPTAGPGNSGAAHWCKRHWWTEGFTNHGQCVSHFAHRLHAGDEDDEDDEDGRADFAGATCAGLTAEEALRSGRFSVVVDASDAEEGATVAGSDGDDFFIGSEHNDRFAGKGGDDVACGRGGDDALLGGGDDDRLAGGRGDDRLEGGNGDDVLLGGRGQDRADGGDGDDDCSAENEERC